MTLRSVLVLAVLIFIVTLLVRLPARLVAGLLPAGVRCDSPGGTLWHGACGELRSGAIALSGVSWRLHAAALLRLRLAADLLSEDPRANGHAGVELARDGEVEVHALVASIVLQNGAGILPVALSGTVQLALPAARIARGRLAAVEGTVDLLQMQIAQPPADLGDFELQFAPQAQGAAMIGQLRDLNGPLAVSGQLRLTADGAYEIDGTVAARAQASANLSRALQMLGPPDAQDRRTFSLAGSL
jgi:hypothetical protein